MMSEFAYELYDDETLDELSDAERDEIAQRCGYDSFEAM